MQSTRFAGVSTAAMAEANRSAVLRLLQAMGPLSQAELAQRSGLTMSAVSKIVRELAQQGLVRKGKRAPSTGGRPPVFVELEPAAAYAVGVNVGYTKVVGVVTDLYGQVIARTEVPTYPETGPDAVLDRVARVAAQLQEHLDPHKERLVGVGVGVPGLVDVESGISRFSPNLRWHDVPVTRILRDRLGVPVCVDNDVRAATLAEHWWGAGERVDNTAVIYVGSAIGSGLVINGLLHYGATGTAGEIGHIVVEPDGPQCGCGKYGCLEAVASGRAIARKASRLARQGGAPILLQLSGGDPDSITAKLVAQAAQQGDTVSRHILEEAGRYIGVAIAVVINLVNPERVVIGGGVSRAGDMLFAAIEKTVRLHTGGIPGNGVQIVPARLGDEAGPRGAATLVLRTLFPSSVLASSQRVLAPRPSTHSQAMTGGVNRSVAHRSSAAAAARSEEVPPASSSRERG